MITARMALERLREGNRRFASDARVRDTAAGPARRRVFDVSQEPFAIVLGCSDSRVPAEIVFDQDVGDLFVIRVAGNIVAASQIGSIEFAAERFGTPLVVVVGHSHCGAVQATLDAAQRPGETVSENLKFNVDRVRPAIDSVLADGAGLERGDLVGRAVRANIVASANQLRRGSAILEHLIRQERLLVVGAEYALETGVVDFFDGVPAG